MRLVLISGLVLTSAACATEKPPTPAPGAFERVADRLEESGSLLGGCIDTFDRYHCSRRRLEKEYDRNPAEGGDGIVIATVLGAKRTHRDKIGPEPGTTRPASDPKPNLPAGAKSADTPN